jgi:GNAT superfamily N-acetyltransferase
MSSTDESIRLATVSDVAEIERLVRRAYQPFVEPIGQEPAPMLDDYGSLVDREVVHVIRGADGLDGVIVMWANTDHLYIDNMAVDPTRQGFGAGVRLLRHAELIAAIAGHREIRLYTNEAMVKNLAFYERRGYVETHRSVDEGYRRVHFRKVLPSFRCRRVGSHDAHGTRALREYREQGLGSMVWCLRVS